MITPGRAHIGERLPELFLGGESGRQKSDNGDEWIEKVQKFPHEIHNYSLSMKNNSGVCPSGHFNV
jgi:hypothetical protein